MDGARLVANVEGDDITLRPATGDDGEAAEPLGVGLERRGKDAASPRPLEASTPAGLGNLTMLENVRVMFTSLDSFPSAKLPEMPCRDIGLLRIAAALGTEGSSRLLAVGDALNGMPDIGDEASIVTESTGTKSDIGDEKASAFGVPLSGRTMTGVDVAKDCGCCVAGAFAASSVRIDRLWGSMSILLCRRCANVPAVIAFFKRTAIGDNRRIPPPPSCNNGVSDVIEP